MKPADAQARQPAPLALDHPSVASLRPATLARVQACVSGDLEPVKPRDSATVVLVREAGHTLQAFLQRRVPSMSFAPGMHVFPGGGVDPKDHDVISWAGPHPSVWAKRLDCTEVRAKAIVVAAVRETFEECGVLLASRSSDGPAVRADGEDWKLDRIALSDRSISIAELLRRRALKLRSDLLHPWSNWVTPEWSPARYDTVFLVARLPDGQYPSQLGGESDQGSWLTPAQAVRGYSEQSLSMMLPTVSTMRELSRHDSIAAILSIARDIRPLMVRPLIRAGQLQLVIDGPRGPVTKDVYLSKL